MAELEPALVEMSAEECADLLAAGDVGRLAFEADGLLHVIPLNYVVDDSGQVVFRTGVTTLFYRSRLDPVAFEVDAFDERARTGWSVCVHGTALAVADGDPDTPALRALPLEPWAPGQRLAWFVIRPRLVTGRRLAWREAGPPQPPAGNRMS